MMNLKYKVCDPSGNITILVTDEVSKEKRIEVADELLKLEPTAQQVGFISKGNEFCDIELNMAGGEFCGNATLSTAVLYNQQNAAKDTVRVKVSGVSEIVDVKITNSNNIFTATAKMPMPDEYYEKFMTFRGKEYKTFFVKFDSMVHLVMVDKLAKEDIETAIKEWNKEIPCSALGIMSYDEESDTLTPAVLSNNGTFFCYESSCASGTTALAIYLAERDNCNIEREIKEPGGVLKINSKPGGYVRLTNTIMIRE